MYVSSCQSVDMRIDIVKYEEGFFIVVKIIKKGSSITNVSVIVRSKTIVKITIELEPIQLNWLAGFILMKYFLKTTYF